MKLLMANKQAQVEDEANARLIAASPEMLDLLKEACITIGNLAKNHNYTLCQEINQLIVKIEGK